MSNELYHHGIPGQKWGVRRFQNYDGTWTEAGKMRYGDGTYGSRNASEDHKSTHSGKRMEQMSTKQLQAHNSRIQAEQQYKKLHPTNVRKGANAVRAILGGIAAAWGTYSTVNAIYGAVTGTGKKAKNGLIYQMIHGFSNTPVSNLNDDDDDDDDDD